MKLITLVLMLIFYVMPVYAQEMDKKDINKILLVVAMDKEAAPIIKKLNLRKEADMFQGLPMQAYVGKYAGKDIFLITNGKDPMYKVDNVATQPAVLATYLGIEHFHPDLIINVGTAGGIAQDGAKLNEIYFSKKIYFYDRRIPDSYFQYGLGGYDSANFDPIINKMKMKTGIICTGNSFDISPTDKEIILKNKCTAIEMEAGSVAWVSMLRNIPMLAIKGIGNIADSKASRLEYIDNGPSIRDSIADVTKEFINHLPK